MVKLSYQSVGRGPLLLLLHPIGLDHTFWGDLPAKLSRSYTIVAVDLAGHGDSPDAVRPGDLVNYAQDVIAVLNELGAGERAILLGISFGGIIAQHVALTRPELVSALILGGCPAVTPANARDIIVKRGSDAEAGGMAAVLEATLDRWFTKPFLEVKQPIEAVRQRLLSDSPSNWAAAWEAISKHDALAGLPALDIPTLVVAGEKDAATSLEAKCALAAAIPGSRLIVVKGAPHMMQIESAEAFGEAVFRFLEEGQRKEGP